MTLTRVRVVIVTPGGLEHGGGIGRQMGYILQTRQAIKQRLRYRVVNSRGPWYIGASPLHVAGAIFYFGRAAYIMLRARLSSRCLAHVNITGRGSIIRKVILLIIARAAGLHYILHLHVRRYAARLGQLHANLLPANHNQSEPVGKGQIS